MSRIDCIEGKQKDALILVSERLCLRNIIFTDF